MDDEDYFLELDGRYVGNIKKETMFTLSTDKGTHSLRISSRGFRGEPARFTIPEGQEITRVFIQVGLNTIRLRVDSGGHKSQRRTEVEEVYEHRSHKGLIIFLIVLFLVGGVVGYFYYNIHILGNRDILHLPWVTQSTEASPTPSAPDTQSTSPDNNPDQATPPPLPEDDDQSAPPPAIPEDYNQPDPELQDAPPDA